MQNVTTLFTNVVEGTFPKPMCRTGHMAPYSDGVGRLEHSRAQNSNHYISRTGIEMRSGAYASSRQDTDYTGAGG